MKNIRNLFKEEGIILSNFIEKINKTLIFEYENYPYPNKTQGLFNEKNYRYSLRNYLLNVLKEILFDEIDFSDINFDLFGSKILAEIVKKCENVYCLRLNNCTFPDEGLQNLLKSLNTFDDFFTLDLSGVKISFNNNKLLAGIVKESYKKKIIFDGDSNLNKQSKVLKNKLNKVKNFTFK